MSLTVQPRRTPLRVTAVRGLGAIATRLMELGFIEGAHVEILGQAPLGGPLQLRVGGSVLSVRRCDADLVDAAIAR